jgi:co-chaperonin GroES (HSP10)
MPFMRMEHTEDPAETIISKVGMKHGEIPGFRLHGNRILVGMYERPEKTKSGIVLTQQTRQEDEYQGKAGLVLMKGHSAFESDENIDFGPDNVKVGDWVMLFVSEGRSCKINGQLCRIIRDQDIAMAIPEPDQVF